MQKQFFYNLMLSISLRLKIFHRMNIGILYGLPKINFLNCLKTTPLIPNGVQL